MKVDFLVAHPLKHHAFHLAAGCVKSGRSALLLTPLYRKGLGALIAMTPGALGRRAAGYVHDDIPLVNVWAPLAWQIRRLAFLAGFKFDFNAAFDSFVAELLLREKIVPKYVATLQDYMPMTVRAAKRMRIRVWSDQILNQSKDAMARISRHSETITGHSYDSKHDESQNIAIVAASDIVTVPSRFCHDGIVGVVPPTASVRFIPYGVEDTRFGPRKSCGREGVRIVARAHTIRKGGHLLIRALEMCGDRLLECTNHRGVEIIVLGRFESRLKSLMSEARLPAGISVVDRDIAHSDVPAMLAAADLFVMPSLAESMSLACVEAMQVGLPLVITEYCGVDVFLNGQMGVVVTDTVESVAQGLIDAFRQQGQWSVWGANCRAAVAKQSWSHYEAHIGSVAMEAI